MTTTCPPDIIIVDTSWTREFYSDKPITRKLFEYFPINDIIGLFTSIPTHSDANEYIWNEIEYRLDTVDVDMDDMEEIDLIIEILIERFYEELKKYVPLECDEEDEEYVFFEWVDQYSLALIKESSVCRVMNNDAVDQMRRSSSGEKIRDSGDRYRTLWRDILYTPDGNANKLSR